MHGTQKRIPSRPKRSDEATHHGAGLVPKDEGEGERDGGKEQPQQASESYVDFVQVPLDVDAAEGQIRSPVQHQGQEAE